MNFSNKMWLQLHNTLKYNTIFYKTIKIKRVLNFLMDRFNNNYINILHTQIYFFNNAVCSWNI